MSYEADKGVFVTKILKKCNYKLQSLTFKYTLCLTDVYDEGDDLAIDVSL